MRSYTARNNIGVVQEGVDLEGCIGVSRAPEGAAPWHGWLQEPLSEDEAWVNAHCMGDTHDPDCGNFKLARGDRRPHRKGAISAKWAMSADLSGPHPAAIGTKFTYLMVAVVTTDEPGQNLPFQGNIERGPTPAKAYKVPFGRLRGRLQRCNSSILTSRLLFLEIHLETDVW